MSGVGVVAAARRRGHRSPSVSQQGNRWMLCFRGRMFSLDFGAMRVGDLAFDRVRRLTTPTGPLPVLGANAGANPSCHTVWKYYCRDNFGWREYSEVSSHTHTRTHTCTNTHAFC